MFSHVRLLISAEMTAPPSLAALPSVEASVSLSRMQRRRCAILEQDSANFALPNLIPPAARPRRPLILLLVAPAILPYLNVTTLNLDTGNVTRASVLPVSSRTSSTGVEFPQVRRSLVGMKTRFGYCGGLDNKGNMTSEIKFDLQVREERLLRTWFGYWPRFTRVGGLNFCSH